MTPAENLSPFKFLEYYEERDADVFGGREREAVEIADRIAQARTYIFYGRSGLGKTSVLLAGVFPELRRRGWAPIYIRTLADPAHDLLRACEALRSELEPEAEPLDQSGARSTRDRILLVLRSLARESGPRPRVVLALDQFEEFFIRFRQQPEVRSEFVAIVAAIARDRQVPVHVVFSLREDYLAEMDDFRSELPELFEDEYRLRAMTAFGVRQAVTRPLDAAHIPYQGRLVTRLLDRLSERRFDPVVLQILCNEIHARARSRAEAAGTELELCVEDLEAVGDIDQVFRRYLDNAAAKLGADEQLIARGVLRCLTTQEHTKQALRLRDFTEAFVRISEQEAQTMLELLASHRLIRIDRRGGDGDEQQTWYELTHDRLVPIITEWLRLDVEFNRLLAAEDLISTSVRSGLWQDACENLLGPGHLDNVIGPFRTRLRLSAEKLELVLRSAIYHSHADVAAWAAEHDAVAGAGTSEQLVLTMIDSADDHMRRGAAHAAGHLPTLGDELAAALVRVGLDDLDEPVRRAAGAALGHARHPKILARVLEQGRTSERTRVVELLADAYAAGSTLAEVPGWLRWRARRLATKRTSRQHAEAIAEARPTAAIGALVAGITWILCLLPYGLMWTMGFVASSEREPEVVFGLSGGVLAGIVVACVPFAWTAGGAAVLRARARGRVTWPAILVGSWVIALGLGLGLGLGLLLIGDAIGPFEHPLAMVGLCVLFWLLLPAAVALARRAIRPDESFASACFWSVMASLGLPLIFAWAVVGMADVHASLVYAAAGLMGSGLTATLTAGVARVALAEPSLGLLDMRRGSKLLDRGLVVASMLFALVFVFITSGRGTMTWQRTAGELAVGQQVQLGGELDPFGGVPCVRRYAVTSSIRAPTRLVVTFSASAGDYGLFAEGRPIPGFWAPFDDHPRTLLVKPGRHTIALVAGGVATDYTLTLDGRSVLRTGSLTLDDDELVYAWTRWARADRSGQAASELVGADVVSSLDGTAKPFELISVSFGERFVLDGNFDQAEFTGLQLHCQGDPILAQQNAGVSNARFAIDGPFVEAPGFDELALTCSTYADADGKWLINFGATLSRESAAAFEGVRVAVAVKRESSDGSLLPTNATAADTLAEQEFSDTDLAYVDFSGKILRASSFENADLSGANFRLADLGTDGAADGGNEEAERGPINDFSGAHGSFADFSGAILTGANFTNANLPSVKFEGVRRANDAKFINATMLDAKFDDAGLEATDFSAAKLAGASMLNARARGASFRDADLSRVDMTGADLREVDFTGAILRGATIDLRSSEAGERPIFDDADVGSARVWVTNPRARIKDVCGKGGYTLIVSTANRDGSNSRSEQWVELPACGKVAESEVPKSQSVWRGACRTAPVPVGIYRNLTKDAEEICRKNPATSSRELRWVDGRYEWDTAALVGDVRVRCSCELRTEVSNKLPPPSPMVEKAAAGAMMEQRDWGGQVLLQRKPKKAY